MTTAYFIPPPTTNTLDPLQRQRLLKSTQKLGALLGTTPRVLESGSVLPPPVTPGTRKFRREGKVFYNQSASSSTTSLSSVDAESFVWIPSPDEMLFKQHHKSASTPIAIEFPLRNSDNVKAPTSGRKRPKTSQSHTTAVPPQQLSQPLLYRLRAVPAPSLPISPPPTSEKSVPLSPFSPTFDTAVRMKSTVRRKTSQKQLTESDRRRKMAKLARTFGENIPPELVFGPPRSSSLTGTDATTTAAVPATTTATIRTISRRNRSATVVRPPTPSASTSFQSKRKNDVPPVPVVRSEKIFIPSGVNDSNPSPLKRDLPVTPIVTVTTTTFVTTDSATEASALGSPRRKHRPRSLTLAHIPIGSHSGIIVEQDQVIEDTSPGHSRSLDEPERITAVRRKETIAAAAPTRSTTWVDYGKRKERDWSGEWNVKDMEDVAMALRGLRIR